MTPGLREGLSWCAVSGRLLFLDLPRDRYFCLAPESEEPFRRLAAGERIAPAQVAALVAAGVLVEGGTAILPCPPAPPARESLFEIELPGAGAFATLGTMRGLTATRLTLRTLGLARTLAGLARGKRRLAGPGRRASVERVAAGLVRMARLTGSLDQCLPHSIAAARAMVALDAAPTLVFGVKLEPFKAHCWVQWGEILVNGRRDEIRAFTPILVL